MLRYGRAVPFGQDDVNLLVGSRWTGATNGKRTVKLIAYAPADGTPGPTLDRWQSFGWTVDPLTIKPA